VLVMSTGIIGKYLPMEKIIDGIKMGSGLLNVENSKLAQVAIMTTDTVPKSAALKCRIGDKEVTIAGICKGSGMINPNMATMLVVLASDAVLSPRAARAALKWVVDRTFNMLTIDGDTSTNDSVFLLANGLAQNRRFGINSSEFSSFREALLELATSLTKQIALDGEGASKFIVIDIKGANNTKSAGLVAKSIANSNLVKTAIYGEDANWGRVICAAGYSGVKIDQERLSLWLSSIKGSIQLVKNGLPFFEDKLLEKKILAQKDIVLTLDLGLGNETSRAWTCDLTHKYIDINAHYHT